MVTLCGSFHWTNAWSRDCVITRHRLPGPLMLTLYSHEPLTVTRSRDQCGDRDFMLCVTHVYQSAMHHI